MADIGHTCVYWTHMYIWTHMVWLILDTYVWLIYGHIGMANIGHIGMANIGHMYG